LCKSLGLNEPVYVCVYLGSPVDVGITMYVSSVSSISEVNMVGTYLATSERFVTVRTVATGCIVFVCFFLSAQDNS